MTSGDNLGRYGRWALGVALLIVVATGGYRLYAERQATQEMEGAGQAATPATDPLAAIEAKARDNPDDAGAWQALGWAYFDAQRYEDAVRAYRQATQLNAGAAVLWSSFGEALVMASAHDPMPAEALAAFRKAVEIDAKDPRGRYFLAVARDLGGDHKGAIADWLALLGDTPPGAPWEQDLRRTIEQVGKINGIETTTSLAAVRQPARIEPRQPAMAAAGIPGPTAEQMRAASAMTPAEQQQMAEGMVTQLEAKLAADPANVGRWAMLIRSRMMLGQTGKARAALASAIRANPGAAETLRAQAATLGLH